MGKANNMAHIGLYNCLDTVSNFQVEISSKHKTYTKLILAFI